MTASCYAPPALLTYFLNLAGSDPNCTSILQAPAEITHIPLALYLTVFLLTCFLESPFYWAVLAKKASPTGSRISAIFLCNLATHPAVCFLIPYLVFLGHGTYAASNAIGEIFAPAVEAFLLIRFWKVFWRPAVAFSIAANLFSWWAGVYFLPAIFHSYF